MTERTCNQCGRRLPLNEFPTNGEKIRWQCKACWNERRKSWNKRYYTKHRDEVIERVKSNK